MVFVRSGRDDAPRRPGASAAPRPTRRSLLGFPALAAGLTILAPGVLTACGTRGSALEPDLHGRAERDRPGDPRRAGSTMQTFVSRLLPALDRHADNLVCSPLSAQIALAMVGIGAGGATRAQLEQAFGADMEEVARAANTLEQLLDGVGPDTDQAGASDGPSPAVAALADAAWMQKGLAVQETYLADLGRWFGTGVYTADFAGSGDRASARTRMNSWAKQTTDGLITDIIQDDTLDPGTALVLLSALFLRAAWSRPLTPGSPSSFTRGDGTTVEVPLLGGTGHHWHEDSLCSAGVLATHGGEIAMVLVRPRKDLETLLDAWAEDPDLLAALLDHVTTGERRTVNISMPAFDVAGGASLRPALEHLGITDLFGPGADLSGIAEDALQVDDVLTKAVISVDQHGIEAAAVSAAVVAPVAAPAEDPVDLVLDQPFVFLAIETMSATPLVAGWVGDPTRTPDD